MTDVQHALALRIVNRLSERIAQKHLDVEVALAVYRDGGASHESLRAADKSLGGAQALMEFLQDLQVIIESETKPS